MDGIKVTASQKQSRLGPTGQAIEVYMVWVETANGATGSIEVPASKWNKADLEAILQAERDRLDLAFNL